MDRQMDNMRRGPLDVAFEPFRRRKHNRKIEKETAERKKVLFYPSPEPLRAGAKYMYSCASLLC